MRARSGLLGAIWALLFGLGMLSGFPLTGGASELPSFPYQSWVASISVSNPEVPRGGTVAATIVLKSDYYCSGMYVACNGAEKAWVNGVEKSVGSYWGTDHLFDANPHIVRSDGAGVSIPNAVHSPVTVNVKFKLRQDFSGSWETWKDSSGVVQWQGPYVIVTNPGYQMWDSLAPFEVGSNPGVDVRISARTPKPGVVQPGQTINYAITATVDQVPAGLAVSIPIPAKTTLIPTSIMSGGKLSGSQIVWHLGAVTKGVVGFAVKVPTAQTVTGVESISASARASATMKDGKSALDTTTVTTRLEKPTHILGYVRDVIVDFPSSTNVNSSRPVAGATVRLLVSGSEVDSTVTDSGGHYQVDAGQPGTYLLEVKKKADKYVGDGIAKSSRLISQRRTVTISGSSTAPKTMDNILLPVSLVDEVAASIKALHSIKLPVAGIPGVFQAGFVQYDTVELESAVEKIISSVPDFEKIYTGTGARDGYNAMIRLQASLALLKQATDQNVQLSDDLAKTLALLVSVETLKIMGKNFAAFKDNGTAQQQMARFFRIGAFANVLPTVIPKILDQFPSLTSQQRATITQITFTILRYASDKYAGKLKDDLLFEVVFNFVRHGVGYALVQQTVHGIAKTELAGVTIEDGIGAYQDYLDNAVGLASRKIYSDDTNTTFAAVETEFGKITNQYLQAHDAAVRALSSASVVRAMNGMVSTRIKWSLGDLSGAAKGEALKAAFETGWVKAVDKATTAAAYTAYAMGIGAPLGAMYLRQGEVNGLISSPFSGVVSVPSVSALVGLKAISADGPEAMSEPLSAVSANLYVTKLLAVLKQVSSTVQLKNIRGYRALVPAMENNANAAFTNYFGPLQNGAQAGLPAGAQRDGVVDFVTQTAVASTQYAFALELLEMWSHFDPSQLAAQEEVRLQALDALNSAILAVASASSDAIAETPVLSTITAPGFLQITGGTLPSTGVKSGQRVNLSFTFKNVGGGPLISGSAVMAPASPLTVVSVAAQLLPSLAAGQAVTLNWIVKTPASTAALVPSYELDAFINGKPEASFYDTFVAAPW